MAPCFCKIVRFVEGFVSKRGNKFSAYLVLSQKQDKADFEFPPR